MPRGLISLLTKMAKKNYGQFFLPLPPLKGKNPLSALCGVCEMLNCSELCRKCESKVLRANFKCNDISCLEKILIGKFALLTFRNFIFDIEVLPSKRPFRIIFVCQSGSIGKCGLVGPKTEQNADQAFETPAPTSPLRPIKAEEHYLRRQLSQSHRAITEDISLLMAEGDKYWYGLKCCTTIIVTILIAILLLVILRWVLYK